MKRVTPIVSAIIIAIVCGMATQSFAQEFQESYKQYEFGPLATGGASVFMGTVPDGAKTDVHVAYTFGIFGDFNFNPVVGFALGLGYESRGVFFKAADASEPNYDIAMSYFAIQPSVKFRSFLLGMNIGLPLSGTVKYTSSLGSASSKINSTDSMGTLIDIRAGVVLPLVENDKGNLDFYVQASYCLTNFFGDNKLALYGIQTDLSKPISSSPVPTLQLGLTYLFSPGGKVYEKR